MFPTEKSETIHTDVVILLHQAEIPRLNYILKLQSGENTRIKKHYKLTNFYTIRTKGFLKSKRIYIYMD